MSFDEEHLDEHYECQREVVERDARIAVLEVTLRDTETVLMLVEPRSHKLEYLALLDKVREVLGSRALNTPSVPPSGNAECKHEWSKMVMNNAKSPLDPPIHYGWDQCVLCGKRIHGGNAGT